eukprot:3862945-Rhodomonas_salina.9
MALSRPSCTKCTEKADFSFDFGAEVVPGCRQSRAAARYRDGGCPFSRRRVLARAEQIRVWHEQHYSTVSLAFCVRNAWALHLQ